MTRAMAAMFRLLLQHQQSQPGRVEQFFATHPATEERVRDAENRAAQLSTAGTITDEPQFQDTRRRVGPSLAVR
jgi:beta-barrel assembly-enhancing protease